MESTSVLQPKVSSDTEVDALEHFLLFLFARAAMACSHSSKYLYTPIFTQKKEREKQGTEKPLKGGCEEEDDGDLHATRCSSTVRKNSNKTQEKKKNKAN